MSYIERRPSARLFRVVERLWRVDDPATAPSPETICPDGCTELVMHLGAPMRGQPRYLLVGQMDSALTIAATGPVVMVGARLTPSGLHQVLPIAQHELLGRVVPLDLVWQQWTRRTADAVSAAGSAERELDTFEHALERLVHSGPLRRDRTIETAWRLMRRQGGPIPVDTMADASGLSRRQFERRFREHVGLSPGMFGRIVRFQHALAALPYEPGAQLAARLGYVDQAHLIKEMRRFSGTTPTSLSKAESLASFFVNRTGL